MCFTVFERRRAAPFLVDKHVSVTNSTDAGCARNPGHSEGTWHGAFPTYACRRGEGRQGSMNLVSAASRLRICSINMRAILRGRGSELNWNELPRTALAECWA